MRVELFSRTGTRGTASVGATLFDVVRRRGLVPADRAWDLLSIALSVVAADTACSRESSPDGWTREIRMRIAVAEPDFWNANRQLLQDILRFLTTDIWTVEFLGKGSLKPRPKKRLALPQQDVSLLSGGLDSLVGVVDLAAGGNRPLVVSQVANGDKDNQRLFAATIGGGLGHIQLNHNVDVPGDAERSQRSRSIVFLAYGVMAATSLTRYHRGESVTLYVPENGFISLNPPLTVDRLGSLSTRTTHPTFLSAFQSLLQKARLRINIENPLRLKTKGEVLLECRDQAYLRQYAHSSTSCGRYARNGFQHCGRCIPCIIRRAAFRKWGERDRTGYRYSKLGQRDKDHALYDDVRSLATALCTVRADGVDQWMSGAVDSRIVGDTAPFKRVVERSILELDDLFEALRVR